MPSVAVKLYSVFFKFLLKQKLNHLTQTLTKSKSPSPSSFGVSTRPDESTAPPNPSFSDGVATKDIHIDPSTSLSIRIFLPDTAISLPKLTLTNKNLSRSASDLSSTANDNRHLLRRNSDAASVNSKQDGLVGYGGYSPSLDDRLRKLPIVLQFHGGGFVMGSCDSVANDFFCRRIAKLCDVVVIAVGCRLAPESRFPAAFEDGMKVLHWLGKQANLAECSKSIGGGRSSGGDSRKTDVRRHITDALGSSMVEPWLAAHGDPSRCVLLGVSCGANIADYVARKVVQAGRLMDPVKVVSQVLMYPFFIGSIPTHSEIKLANSYFYDKAMCLHAWKLFLPEDDFSLDHTASNPLIPGREPPLKCMPPTLTVVAEHDWMRDRAIAYSEELRKVNVDAPVLDYKDAVHEFATLDMLLRTPQAQACAEDIAIWVKKYISQRGHEFSY